MIGARWLATARASHTRAMGAAQNFPLLGDGAETARTLNSKTRDPETAGAALAEARYRDWFTARASGALDVVTPRAAPYTAPALSLTSEVPAATQARLTIPLRAARAFDSERLATAERIIRGLADEFAELFPDELAAAVAWLKADAG